MTSKIKPTTNLFPKNKQFKFSYFCCSVAAANSRAENLCALNLHKVKLNNINIQNESPNHRLKLQELVLHLNVLTVTHATVISTHSCLALFVGTTINQKLHNIQSTPLTCNVQRCY